MNPKYRGAGRFLRTPFTIGVLAVVIAVLVGVAFAVVLLARTGNEGPNSTVAPLAQPSSNAFQIYLTPSGDDSQSLSLVNTGLAVPALAQVPLNFGTTIRRYLDLRNDLWSESSITFSGSGFAGAWTDNDEARLVLQLNGPMKDAEYFQCLAIRINGEEVSWSCATGFSKYEFVPGCYTVVMKIQAPLRLEPSDRVEISFVLGTPFRHGEKTVPNLVYGGDAPVRSSFLEIGNSLN